MSFGVVLKLCGLFFEFSGHSCIVYKFRSILVISYYILSKIVYHSGYSCIIESSVGKQRFFWTKSLKSKILNRIVYGLNLIRLFVFRWGRWEQRGFVEMRTLLETDEKERTMKINMFAYVNTENLKEWFFEFQWVLLYFIPLLFHKIFF